MTVSLDLFRHILPLEIRFGDLDAMGHVNNAMYLTYMEAGRVRYFRELGIWDGAFPRLLGPIMARAVVDFKLPLGLEDSPVEVCSRVSRLGNRSYDMEQIVVCQRAGQRVPAASGQIVIVVYDYAVGTSAPIPDAWRERLTAYEPGLGAAR